MVATRTLSRAKFWIVALTITLSTSVAWARVEGTVLRESDVVRLARQGSPTAAIARATQALAHARAQAAHPLANPTLQWSRETIETRPQASQDILAATVPLDIARPLAKRSLTAAASAWTGAQAMLAETQAILQAVLAYYDAVMATQEVRVLSTSLAHLDEAKRVLTSKENAGQASGYERTRLAIARAIRNSDLAEAQGELQEARIRLALRIGASPESIRVPSSFSRLSANAEARLVVPTRTHPASDQARDALRFAHQAQKRASWSWVPTFKLQGGFKRARDQAIGYGYALGISMAIPLADRGQALRAEAGAQEALYAARSRALTQTFDADRLVASARFGRARRELDDFESETQGQVDTLLAAAQSGYREGAYSIVELLDAQRTQIAVSQKRLHLLRRTKQAEAELRATVGDWQ